MKNVIYSIYNKLTGEDIYIGQTKRDHEVRFAEHLRELKTGWHNNLELQLTYEKVGADNVGFRILEQVKTITERERELINANIKLTNAA